MYIRGKKATLLFLKGGEYLPFRCTTDCALTISTETVQVRTINDGVWAKPRGARQSYTVSLTGLIELQEEYPVTFWLIENYVMQMLPVTFRMLFEDPVTALIKIVDGNAIIKTATTTGVPVGFATGAFEMEGVGAPVISDSTTICEATIGSILIGATENPNEISVGYEDVTGAVRLEYSVDGNPREAIFDPGSNGSFTISGLSEGPHTLEVWAVCESGIDGEYNEQTFDIAGGVPEGCAVPGTPVVSELTGSSGHFAWSASPSTPGDGYYWELRFAATGNVASSAFTNDTFTDVFGMINGVDYIFVVKALCTEGVSESPFVQVEFTSEAPPSCNIPGAPVMSAITSTTATATWTAPSPVPGDGYGWRLFEGLTLVDSGTTAGLSVNLTGLSPDATYTFQVKSVCSTGVNESGYNSVGFNTEVGTNNIDWTFNEDLGNGSLVIRVDGLTVVNVTAAGTGNFSATSGQSIEIRLTASTGQVTAEDTTASVQVANETGSALIIASFNTFADHSYDIQAIVTS